jgi:type IV secretory pathway protease TraF
MKAASSPGEHGSPRRRWCLLAGLLVLLSLDLWARAILTPSLPRGLYLAAPPGRPAPRDIVEFCPPRHISALLLHTRRTWPGPCDGGSAPLAKRLAAIAPYVCASQAGLQLNDSFLTWPRFPDGLRLPRFRGCSPQSKDCLFLVGDSADSIDSRVFGCIPPDAVRRRLYPLLTEELWRTSP